jgi:tetratricopeptide (TPR) repeat protein
VSVRALAAALLGWGLAAGAAAQQAESPWYHERGTAPRPLPPGESRLDTALKLSALLRDGQVPGFYDGQFTSVKDRFDDLASIAGDPDMNHVLRVVAVMALQEAGDGEPVRKALEPLLIPASAEFGIELENEARSPEQREEEDFVRDRLAANLSQYARFSLAKDGQPAQVLAKIREMEQWIHDDLPELLDPNVDSDSPQSRIRGVAEGRRILFDIGYHYQQFDDFSRAAEWFSKLCDNLPGKRDTQMAHYNLGCIEALSGRPESAIAHLRAAHAVGFTNVQWVLEDGDLASLRDRPDFAALVALMRNQEPPEAPSDRSTDPPTNTGR